ncbi:DUF38 domain-containing protein [Caenorhabditis elegans]|uniref:DUF38 domain-containing protein n=1 Tax=Caenorhabditis elegans TaxID=6239 RepID=A7LPJ5_CAEEL|nr:DUF38 domain-containing protein [Caenorhabditis elegans]CAO82019.1 DUF38 domain-containing protein [Caenorhabditis elegans]|eukprot:NP_001122906.1 Uncharacterized protein CELE_F10A3.17 [Caenorhabditis elegans]
MHLKLNISNVQSNLTYNDIETEYQPIDNGSIVTCGKDSTIIKDKSHAELSINEFAEKIQDSTVKLESVEINICNNVKKQNRRDIFNSLLKVFQAKSSKLHVSKCILGDLFAQEILLLLPFFQAGEFETIELSNNESMVGQLNEISKLEQWKKAKILNAANGKFEIPIENLFHFEKFTISLTSFSKEDSKKIKDRLYEMEHFGDGCFIFPKTNIIEIARVFDSNFYLGESALFDCEVNYKCFIVEITERFFKIRKG